MLYACPVKMYAVFKADDGSKYRRRVLFFREGDGWYENTPLIFDPEHGTIPVPLSQLINFIGFELEE